MAFADYILLALQTFTEQAKDRTIEARSGEEFEIVLAENPTAGFRWRIIHSGEPVCSRVGDSFKPGGNVGQPGSHSWVFKVVRPGTAKIELAYGRTWQQVDAGTNTFQVRIDAGGQKPTNGHE